MTLLVLGLACGLIGYLAADVWLTPDRQWSPFDADQRDRATLALAVAGVYGVLHVLT